MENERCIQIKRQFGFGEQSNTEIEINCTDNKGNIISSALYETDKILQTKEIYKYDERGNPIEFLAYDAKGKLHTKEKHEYEFDSQGNWMKEKTKSWNWDEYKKVERFVRIIKRTISYY